MGSADDQPKFQGQADHLVDPHFREVDRMTTPNRGPQDRGWRNPTPSPFAVGTALLIPLAAPKPPAPPPPPNEPINETSTSPELSGDAEALEHV